MSLLKGENPACHIIFWIFSFGEFIVNHLSQKLELLRKTCCNNRYILHNVFHNKRTKNNLGDLMSGDFMSYDAFLVTFCPGNFWSGTLCPMLPKLGTICSGTLCPGTFWQDTVLKNKCVLHGVNLYQIAIRKSTFVLSAWVWRYSRRQCDGRMCERFTANMHPQNFKKEFL